MTDFIIIEDTKTWSEIGKVPFGYVGKSHYRNGICRALEPMLEPRDSK